jgi:hypothetical protein
MNYTNAAATALFATHCLFCGRPLLDANSVQTGVGPVCREKWGVNIEVDEESRETANKIIHEAALSATSNDRRVEIATQLDELGFGLVASKVRQRFLKAAVTIETREMTFGPNAPVVEAYVVLTGSYNAEFVDALKAEVDWTKRTVLRDEKGKFVAWAFAPSAKTTIWNLIKVHFAGQTGFGPKGVFQIA